MKDLENVKLYDLLPESIREDATVKAIVASIEPELQRLLKLVDAPILWANIDNLSSAQLDHLAVQYDLATWRDYWPVTLKRSVLKTAFVTKRKLGTVSAVKDVLASIGSATNIVEWWQTEPKGVPYTFNIVATLSEIKGTLSAEMQEDLQNMIFDTKPARSHFTFTLSLTQEGELGVLGYARPLVLSRISDLT